MQKWIAAALCATLVLGPLPSAAQTEATDKRPSAPSIETTPEMLDVVVQHAMRQADQASLARFLMSTRADLVEAWLNSAMTPERSQSLNTQFASTASARQADSDRLESDFAVHAATVSQRLGAQPLGEYVSRTDPAAMRNWQTANAGIDFRKLTLLEYTRALHPALLPEASRIDETLRRAVGEREGSGGGQCFCAYFFATVFIGNEFTLDVGDNSASGSSHRRSWWGFHGQGPSVAGELHVFSKRGDTHIDKREFRLGRQIRGWLSCSLECDETGDGCTLQVAASNTFDSTAWVYVRRGGGIAKRHAIAEAGAVGRSAITGPGGLSNTDWGNGVTNPVLRKSHDHNGYIAGVISIINIVLGVSTQVSLSAPSGIQGASGKVIANLKDIAVFWDAGNGSSGAGGPTPPSAQQTIVNNHTLASNAGMVISEVRLDGTTGGEALGRQGADSWSAFATAYSMGLNAHTPKCSAGVLVKPAKLTLVWASAWNSKIVEVGSFASSFTLAPAGNATSNATKIIDNLLPSLMPYVLSGEINLSTLGTAVTSGNSNFILP